MPKPKRRKGRPRLSPAEKKKLATQRIHRKEIRSVFSSIGFKRIRGASDKEFTFQGTTSDFDDVFIYENVIVLLEYTTHQQSEISEHLKKKKVLYDKIESDHKGFIDCFDAAIAGFKSDRGSFYKSDQYRVVIV